MIIKTFDDLKQYITINNNIKRCIMRCDFNIPSDFSDTTRIVAIRETLAELFRLNLDVILITHYKRPTINDVFNPKYSLQNIILDVADVLQMPVDFIKNSIFDIEPTSITSRLTLLENIRFYEGEETNDDELAQRLSIFGDIFINDAFSVSHRAHASVAGITKFLPSFAGLALNKEITNISKLTKNISRPYTAIIGGSKISSKINVLKNITNIADYLIITGAMANTFLAAQGFDLKNSLVFKEQYQLAIDIMKNSKAKIVLPIDFLASKNIQSNGENFDIKNIPDEYSCFDIGAATTQKIIDIIEQSKTILWNGATGAFEFANFDISSKAIANKISEQTQYNKLISIVGGGETVASIANEIRQNISFISTAGGAFLQFVAGENLPGLEALS